MLILQADALSPELIAWASRALTAVVGLFVAVLAYRGFQRNEVAKMRSLAVGVGTLTAGVFLVVTIAGQLGAQADVILIARGIATVVGLSAVLYALLYD
ncbi:hypothetical protein ACFQE1_02405 [Halobium palmae]|uniref:DUF2339 domain-containing protein n=1 Tax=Halobium palmae TaxID=1776492 RepID=A0ABD5RWZ5_9EURY